MSENLENSNDETPFMFSEAVDKRANFLGSLANFSTSKNSFNNINDTFVNININSNNNVSDTPPQNSENEQFSAIKDELVANFIQFTEYQGIIKNLLTDFKLTTMGSDSSTDLNTFYEQNKEKYKIINDANPITISPPEQPSNLQNLQKNFEDTTNKFFGFIESKIDPIGNYFSSVNEKSSFCVTLAEVKCFFDSWEDVKTQAYYLIDLLRETNGQEAYKIEGSTSIQSSSQNDESNPYHDELVKTIFEKK